MRQRCGQTADARHRPLKDAAGGAMIVSEPLERLWAHGRGTCRAGLEGSADSANDPGDGPEGRSQTLRERRILTPWHGP